MSEAIIIVTKEYTKEENGTSNGEEFEEITTWKVGMEWEVAIEELRKIRDIEIKRLHGR